MVAIDMNSRLRPFEPCSIVGCSPWATRIRGEIQLLGRNTASVLVTGPTGTGKELIARWIHAASDRSGKPFVPVDCAAASDSLFASQLFGHTKGAFTGAHHESLGAFRAADGGTIFLDEIGELNVQLQVKLLRTLQQRAVVPVGGLSETPIDVRVIAATNRDLLHEIGANRFREDLYYRLNVVTLETQALMHRREDIPELVDAILARLAVQQGIGHKFVSSEAIQALLRYNWPGNVRQLGNILERAAVYCDHTIDLEHLPSEIAESPADGRHPYPSTLQLGIANAYVSADRPTSSTTPETKITPVGTHWPTMDEVERQHLLGTLQHTNYNQTAAAQLLDLDRNAIRRMARRLGIDISRRPGCPLIQNPPK